MVNINPKVQEITERMQELELLFKEVEEKLKVYSDIYFTLFDQFSSVVITTRKLEEKVKELVTVGLDFSATKEAFKSSKKEGFLVALVSNVLPLGLAMYHGYKAHKEREKWESYLSEKLSTIEKCRRKLMNLKKEQINFARNYATEMMEKLFQTYPYFYQFEITRDNFHFYDEKIHPFLQKSTATYYRLLRLKALTFYTEVLYKNVERGELLDRKTASEHFLTVISTFPEEMFRLCGGENLLKSKVLGSGYLFFTINENFSSRVEPWKSHRKKIVKLAKKRGIKI